MRVCVSEEDTMEQLKVQSAITQFKEILKNTHVTGAVVYGSWAYGVWKAGKVI